jgi:hypothetical protein
LQAGAGVDEGAQGSIIAACGFADSLACPDEIACWMKRDGCITRQ